MSDPLTEIKQLYFRTSRATIQQDFDRAIDLLKSLPTEEERERVTVYMQGLAEMKSTWLGTVRSAKSEVRSPSGVRSAKSVRSAEFGVTSSAKSEVRSAKSDVRGPKSDSPSETFEHRAKPKPGPTR